MKIVSVLAQLEEFGIVVLTGEACSLMYRVLCDLTDQGKRVVEKCLSVEIRSEPWNSGSNDHPHVASIMLTSDMVVPLAVFALLESGCREVWVTEHAAIGIEPEDTQEDMEGMKRVYKPQRRIAYHGPHQDRNLHQMSGRVLLWRSPLCGLARSFIGISAFRQFFCAT